MSIAEYMSQASASRFWVCPNLVTDSKISADPFLCGIECTRDTVPQELQSKEVVKHFYEAGLDCIIWKNVEEEGPTGMGIPISSMQIVQM